ncbi:MAG TPA: HEPN domain-containing protein [Anaerolineae bacterium]|nr:HEPN domain-containing protein [Anaerolineae bacterium]
MTRLELAEILLADARWNMQGARYRSTISRAYFACYHAARACLERQGIQVMGRNLHSGTLHLFSLHLVQTDLFPGWMGRVLNRLRDSRVAADYSSRVIITGHQAGTALRAAERFLQEVQGKWDGR